MRICCSVTLKLSAVKATQKRNIFSSLTGQRQFTGRFCMYAAECRVPIELFYDVEVATVVTWLIPNADRLASSQDLGARYSRLDLLGLFYSRREIEREVAWCHRRDVVYGATAWHRLWTHGQVLGPHIRCGRLMTALTLKLNEDVTLAFGDTHRRRFRLKSSTTHRRGRMLANTNIVNHIWSAA